MTIEQFRQNPALTDRMRELMADETFVLATEALRNSNPPVDPPAGSPEIVSVRMLSQMTGYRIYEEKLRDMGTPLPPVVELVEEFAPEVPEN